MHVIVVTNEESTTKATSNYPHVSSRSFDLKSSSRRNPPALQDAYVGRAPTTPLKNAMIITCIDD